VSKINVKRSDKIFIAFKMFNVLKYRPTSANLTFQSEHMLRAGADDELRTQPKRFIAILCYDQHP